MNQTFLILAGALCAGLTVTGLLRSWNLSLGTNQVARTLDRYYRSEDSQDDDWLERLGRGLLARVSLGRFSGEHQRRWIALEEPPPSAARTVALAALLGGAGIAAAVLNGMPFLILAGLLGMVYPFARLRSRAHKVQRRVERALPELSALMAAEMAAGNPLDRSLERAGQWGGPLAQLITRSITEARLSGRPLFGRGQVRGVWREVVDSYRLPSLRAFAAQVDLAAQKGAAGPQMMAGLAHSLIIAYKDQALREAEKLENPLAVPSVLFFFLPFLFLILTPLLMPVLDAL